jgi:hypothetical protein
MTDVMGPVIRPQKPAKRNRTHHRSLPRETLSDGVVSLILWCKRYSHGSEPDIATQVAQHGSGMAVPDWARLLRCTECGERDANFVVSGARR